MWSVVGHDRAVSLLQHGLEKGTLAHAYLMVGPPHVGKMTLALDLARALNCEAAAPPCGKCASCQKAGLGKHADVQIIGLTGNGNSAEARNRAEIGIGQIREMQSSASLPPFEGRHKVFIIDGAEHLSIEAANCLLKTLEEPTGRVLFVLLATSDRFLPATVVSRCQRLELFPLAAAEVEVVLVDRWGTSPEKAKLLARLCHGCPGWAISAATDDGWLRQRTERIDRLLDVSTADYEECFTYATELAAQFGQNRWLAWEVLDLWRDWWRDLLLVKAGCSDVITNVDMSDTFIDQAGHYSLLQIKSFIKSIRAAKEQLRQNANPQLALEVLMLDIPRRG
ncbi:ATP-binding protein [Chloroflexota bacterium]